MEVEYFEYGSPLILEFTAHLSLTHIEYVGPQGLLEGAVKIPLPRIFLRRLSKGVWGWWENYRFWQKKLPSLLTLDWLMKNDVLLSVVNAPRSRWTGAFY